MENYEQSQKFTVFCGQVKFAKRGELIVQKGDVASSLYFIVEGQLLVQSDVKLFVAWARANEQRSSESNAEERADTAWEFAKLVQSDETDIMLHSNSSMVAYVFFS